jgi:hypothetical protein
MIHRIEADRAHKPEKTGKIRAQQTPPPSQ